MRPGLTRDEMNKLVARLSEMVQGGAEPENAWEVLKATDFRGVDPKALDAGFKAWAFRRAGLVEGAAASPSKLERRAEAAKAAELEEPPAEEPKHGKRKKRGQ